MIGFKVNKPSVQGKKKKNMVYNTRREGRRERKNTVCRDEGREGIEKTWQAGPSMHNQWYGLTTSQTNYRNNLMG